MITTIDMERLLFDLLRCSLNGEELDSRPFADMEEWQWEWLFALSCPHNISAIVYDAVARLPEESRPPRAVFLKWAVMTDQIETLYRHKKAVAGELARFYAEAGIDMMVLKGLGVSVYYPVPEHRSFSDVDIYLYGDVKKADLLISEKLGIEVSDDVHHHTTFEYKGVLIENHYDFINVHDHKSNRSMERLLKEFATQHGGRLGIDGVSVLLPAADFNALFLMRHMSAHYAAERISIRHLCDWMMFLKREHAKIDFEKINALYRQFNMNGFACAVNGILIDRFGMSADLLPPFERDHYLEMRIMNDIIYPEFAEKRPEGATNIVRWKLRRFMANRWKHKLIYNESWVATFFQSAFSHLLKPATIKH